MRKARWFIAFAFGFLLTSPGVADNWPQFRGPNGAGVAEESKLPEAWSAGAERAMEGRGAGRGLVFADRVGR